jgi:ribosomal protein S18 acetylase RimI-like enzyme
VHPLDNPVWSALTGPHADFAQRRGAAARYPADIAPFAALAADADGSAWADFATLGNDAYAFPVLPVPRPDGWPVLAEFPIRQMIQVTPEAGEDPEIIILGSADVPEMLDLVARTTPGPFRPRTIELGRYLGIRHDGRLIAMAGERLRVAGHTEISAVCTDPGWRRRGLGARLIRAVAAGIRGRAETPFLHVTTTNTTAISLYESLGFQARRDFTFVVVQVPAAS